MEKDLSRACGEPIGRRILGHIRGENVLSDETFSSLALELHEHQLAGNPFFRRYCEAQGRVSPSHWREIPALPASAFKRAAVACFPPEDAVAVFRTSGTTEGESGLHYFRTLDYYDAALIPGFRRFVLAGIRDIRMLILTPSPAEAPQSSLVHMLEVVRLQFGTEQSSYYVEGDQLDARRLLRDLEECERSSSPVLVLGTAFALVHASDAIEQDGNGVALPPGSRVMETGGFKGRSRELTRTELYELLAGRLGVPVSAIINEYGMTELSSQFYDRTTEAGEATDMKWYPPWCRVRIVDPETGGDMPVGQRGLIRIVDLANVDSVAGLQTEDVGEANADGWFRVIGRVEQAPVRGCSLDAEELRRSGPR